MMTKFLIVAIGLLGLAGLQSCGINDPSPSPQATVESHFFPQDNGLLYTYIRFNHNTYDTLTCRLILGQTVADKNALVDTKTDSALYYMRFTHDANGNYAAELSNGDTTLLALDGQLLTGATWVADEVHNIHATVVGHYDDYYLPGRLIHFSDVLAVKYHQDTQPDNVYTLRFFARDRGIVFERNLVGPNTEIASLQLLSVEYPSTLHHGKTANTGALPQSIIFAEHKK